MRSSQALPVSNLAIVKTAFFTIKAVAAVAAVAGVAAAMYHYVQIQGWNTYKINSGLLKPKTEFRFN